MLQNNFLCCLFDLKVFIVNLHTNPFILKLPQLLSHFLYQNKTLALPGIGNFTLDPSTAIPEWTEKEQPQVVHGIEFENVAVLHPDSALIDFIHKYTGKMKPLAESDLDSYLGLGIQLLNIGKPFYLEGIGSVLKTKEGKYEFTPGEFNTVRLVLPGDEKTEIADKRRRVLDEPEKEYSTQSKTAKQIFLTIGIMGGIAIIAWAGYNLYKKKTVPVSNSENSSVVLKDDTATETKNDTVANTVAAQPDSTELKKKDSISIAWKQTDTNQYKFVILATANKYRALKRFNQLLSFELKVKMDTKDSSFFKIYFPLHVSPKDTLRIRDSLNTYYGTKTIIEH